MRFLAYSLLCYPPRPPQERPAPPPLVMTLPVEGGALPSRLPVTFLASYGLNAGLGCASQGHARILPALGSNSALPCFVNCWGHNNIVASNHGFGCGLLLDELDAICLRLAWGGAC